MVTMALDGTEKGTRHAAQALSRIGITQDPKLAFPGNRSVDIVRPICSLLNTEYSGIENFEALMALGNLATGTVASFSVESINCSVLIK